jgi:hypothetical protein
MAALATGENTGLSAVSDWRFGEIYQHFGRDYQVGSPTAPHLLILIRVACEGTPSLGAPNLTGTPDMLNRTLLFAAAALAIVATQPASAQQRNQFGTYQNSPHIYTPNGTYLGNLNDNQFDPNSVSNPYGPHGSQFAPNSINNPYTYGSPYGYTPGGGRR